MLIAHFKCLSASQLPAKDPYPPSSLVTLYVHMITVVRLRFDPRTIAYTEHRRAEGLSKRDVMRCLKRFIAREVYHDLKHDLAAAIAARTSSPLGKLDQGEPVDRVWPRLGRPA